MDILRSDVVCLKTYFELIEIYNSPITVYIFKKQYLMSLQFYAGLVFKNNFNEESYWIIIISYFAMALECILCASLLL